MNIELSTTDMRITQLIIDAKSQNQKEEICADLFFNWCYFIALADTSYSKCSSNSLIYLTKLFIYIMSLIIYHLFVFILHFFLS